MDKISDKPVNYESAKYIYDFFVGSPNKMSDDASKGGVIFHKT